MTHFVSKLQFKHYEKGEFSAEQKRTLQETLNLVEDFPWAEQPRFTSIKEPGPSITIRNNHSEYIKLGSYFSGKYCVYYRNKRACVSTFYADNLTEIAQIIIFFFENRLNVNDFEKDLFGWISKYHFVTKKFVYSVKLIKTLLLSGFLIMWFALLTFLLCLTFFETKLEQPSIGLSVIIIACFLLSLSSLCKVSIVYCKYKNRFLKVSKASLTFTYSNGIDIKEYNKDDIKTITTYSPNNSRSPNLFHVFTIKLIDGDEIKFNNMMISSGSVAEKFSNAKFIKGKGYSLWKL